MSVINDEEAEDSTASLIGERNSVGVSFLVCGCMMTAQMNVIGLISIPVATAKSGWISVGLLSLCGCLAWLSAAMFAAVMLRTPFVVDYPSVGKFAMGRFGQYASVFGQYSLLFGASCTFLILLGQLMEDLVCEVPRRAWSGVFALFALVIVIAVPTLKKAKWVAIFAVVTMFFACIVIVVLSADFAVFLHCSSGG